MKITDLKIRTLKYSAPSPRYVMTHPLNIYEKFGRQMEKRYEETIKAKDTPGEDELVERTLNMVEVHTDEEVLGRYYVESSLQAYIIKDYLKPLLIDEDPFNTEMLWDQMYRVTLPFGRKGAAIMAIGSVDVALWDIKGKALNQPVFRLLGGATRERIRAYASHLHPTSPEKLANEAITYVKQGFTAMKQRLIAGPAEGVVGMKKNLDLVKIVRDAVGYDVELMADCWMSWNLDYAIKMIKKLEKYELSWVEEPLIPDDLSGYAKVRAAVNTPISGGEHEYTMYGFKQLIEKEAVDILQPDIVWSGGITSGKKICALAEVNEIPVIPHYSRFPTVHLIISNTVTVCPMTEFMTRYRIFEFMKEPIVAKNGYVEVPNRAGLGIVWDEDAILKHTFQLS